MQYPFSGGIHTYDFTNSSDNIYGTTYSCKQLAGGNWGMVSGDGTGEGNVNNQGKNDIWFQQNGSTGYFDGDYNMDGTVNDTDLNDFWRPNSGMGSQVK